MAAPLGAFTTGSITYNGINIDFTEVLEYTHESIYDGPQFLYTKHTIHVRGVVSTVYTNFIRAAGLDANVANEAEKVLFNPANNADFAVTEPIEKVRAVAEAPFVRGNEALNTWAPESLREIQERLSIPRKKLTVQFNKLQDGDVLYLESPLPDPDDAALNNPDSYECDAIGGPFPEVVNVVKLYGHKTFAVEFKITTCIADRHSHYFTEDLSGTGLQKSRALSAILSNTYEMSHDVDMHFLTVRTIQGACVVDRGILEQALMSIDDLREIVLPPVPELFRRDNVHVNISPDGTTMQYVVVDRQTLLQPYDELTKVELVQGINEDILSAEEVVRGLNIFGTNIGGIIGAAVAGGNAINNAIDENVQGPGFGPLVRAILKFPVAVSKQLANPFAKKISKGAVPAISHGFRLNLYGTGRNGVATSIPDILYDKATTFLNNFATLANLTANGIAGNFTRDIRFDHAGSHLEMEVKFTGSALFNDQPTNFKRVQNGLPLNIGNPETDRARVLLLAMRDSVKAKLGGEPGNGGVNAANINQAKKKNSIVMGRGKYQEVAQPPRLKRGQAATFVYPPDRTPKRVF